MSNLEVASQRSQFAVRSQDITAHAASKNHVASDMCLGGDCEGESCFHRATRFLNWLLEEENDDCEKKLVVGRQYIVRTATMKIQVGCYTNETISDLMARVVQFAKGVEQQQFGKAAMCVWTSKGDLLAPSTSLGDLLPEVELILGQTLCEATITECLDNGCAMAHTSAISTTASLNDELEDVAMLEGCAAAGPSAYFISEPHLGPCVLVNDGHQGLRTGGSSEQLVCTMTF